MYQIVLLFVHTERLVPRIQLNETSYTICEGRQVDLPLWVENFDGILPDMEVLLNNKSVPISSWSYNHTGRLFKLLPTSNMSFAGGWSIIVRNERDEAMANLTIETESKGFHSDTDIILCDANLCFD